MVWVVGGEGDAEFYHLAEGFVLGHGLPVHLAYPACGAVGGDVDYGDLLVVCFAG